jgi:ribosomal protein S18 acetylase RimI-like enzyme
MLGVRSDERSTGGSADVVKGSSEVTRPGNAASAHEANLDWPVWAALNGPHAHLAERRGGAARYPIDVSPFAAVSPDGEQSVWDDLAALIGGGGTAALIDSTPPRHWETLLKAEGTQMVDVRLDAKEHPDVEPLSAQDVPAMLDLVSRTRPGPFLPRTIEFGGYLGIRRNGSLVAMAGQRLRPEGWTEISAVCTDEAHRGQGLGSILVRAVAAEIRDRGDTPFLHAAAGNLGAIRLYESLGFAIRRSPMIRVVKAPE